MYPPMSDDVIVFVHVLWVVPVSSSSQCIAIHLLDSEMPYTGAMVCCCKLAAHRERYVGEQIKSWRLIASL